MENRKFPRTSILKRGSGQWVWKATPRTSNGTKGSSLEGKKAILLTSSLTSGDSHESKKTTKAKKREFNASPTLLDHEQHGGSHLRCQKCLSNAKIATNTSRANEHSMVTRGLQTSISRNAVFNTSELLENILLQVQEKDILTARRVNGHFNAIIMISPRIQRKLFLLAEPDSTVWMFNSRDTVVKEKGRGESSQAFAEWTVPSKLNRLLFTTPTQSRASLEQRVTRCEAISLLMKPNLSQNQSIHRKMLVAQPPPKEVQFEVYYSKKTGTGKFGYYGDGVIRAKIENKDGVTFGDLVRAFQSRLGAIAEEEPSGGYVIKIGPSVVFMGGIVFPTEDEVAMVKKNGT